MEFRRKLYITSNFVWLLIYISQVSLESLRNSAVLPSPQWIIKEASNSINICKVTTASSTTHSVVSHSLIIKHDFSWSLNVHGHKVSHSNRVSYIVPDKLNQVSLNDLLSKLKSSTVCPGHPDEHLVEMASLKKGTLKSIGGKKVVAVIDRNAPVWCNGQMYTQTIRNNLCEIFVPRGFKSECNKCESYGGTHRKSFYRQKAKELVSPNQRTTTTSRTNIRFLSTPEKRHRYRRLKIRSDTAERKLN